MTSPLVIPRLDECCRVQGTVKLWLAPSGRFIPLEDLHFRWIRANPETVAAETGAVAPSFGELDEQRCRLWALDHGFIRVCYGINGGRLVVEARQHALHGAVRKAVIALQRANSDMIDAMEVRIIPGADSQS